MTEAVIIDAVRTPGGKRNGQLKDWHPASLAAHTLQALQERNGLDPAMVDDVVMGCVMQVGEQSLNIGRNAVLAAGWPEEVPSTTVDRQCGSSQQAMHFAAQGVIAGAYDVVVAAGVEVMTRTPMGASIVQGMGFPFPQEQQDRYAETGLPPQGIGAEMIADEYGLSREDLDAFGAQSQQRASHEPSGHRYHLNRQRERAESFDQFAFVDDTDELLSRSGNDFFPGQCSAGAFDQRVLRVNLVSTVNIDGYFADSVQIQHRYAMVAQSLAAGFAARYGCVEEMTYVAQTIDEMVGG